MNVMNRVLGRYFAFSLFAGTFIATAATAADPAVEQLEEVVVTAHQREYRLDSAETAIGLDLKIIETPAAISVITADLLNDQQVNNVDDALRNVAGVTKFKTGNGGEERFSIRGFDSSQSIYKDGARINNALNASNIPSTETANIERIEVLKGSSALLYGQGEPGGVINYITKRPEFERQTTIEVLAGSDSFKKLEIDTTGAFGDSNALAYRLVGAYLDSDNFRNEVFRKRLLLNPTLAFHPSENTEIVLGYEYIDDEYTQDRGQVLDGDIINGYDYSDRLNESQFFGIPGWNRNTTAESSRFYVIASHQVNEYWRVEANYSKTSNEKINFDSSPSFINVGTRAIVGAAGTPDANLVLIGPRKTDGEGDTSRYNLKNFIDFTDGFGFGHQILASVSKEEFSTNSTSFRGDRVVMFNVETGEYASEHQDPAAPGNEEIRINDQLVFGLLNFGFSNNQEFEETGFNVLDYIRLNDHWAWLIGGRYSDFEDNRNDFDDDEFSLRTGLVYSVNDSLSLYTSYAEGYTNSGGRLDADRQPIDPETSVSWELGSKLQLFKNKLLLTATLFHTEKEDIAFIVNPDAPQAERFYDNLGAIRSQGLELEVVGHINDQWRLQAGYAYIDNEITEGGTGNFGNIFTEGNTLGGVAEHNFNLFTFYEFPFAAGDIGVGGGLYYQDDVFISTENRSKYDSWTQVDLATYYKQGPWKFQLNVRNLGDEEYRQAQALTTTDTFAAIRVGTSSPREFTVSVAYEI